jgi:O-antigen/teichoic acid export membrane protein
MNLSLLRSPTAISTGLHGLGLALRLLFLLVLVRDGSPALLGYFGLLMAIDVIVIYASGFELHTFTTRRYARHANPTQLRICFAVHTRLFRLSVPLAAAFAVAAAWIFDVELDATSYACFGIVAASGTVVQEIGRYLVIMAMPIRAIFLSVLRTAGWMPAVMPMLGGDRDSLRTITIAWAVASVVATVWGLHAVRAAWSRRLRMRTRYVLHALARSLNYYAVATAGVMQTNVERFVLQVMLGPTAVGIYSLFVTLASTLTALVQAGVLNIFLPRLLLAFGSLTANRRAVLSQAMKRALAVSVLMAIVILVASVPITRLTGHDEYLQYWWILPVLLFGQILLAWTQPVHLALYGAHHDRLLLTITMIFLAISLAASASFIGIAGIAGAAVAPVAVNLALAYTRWRAFTRVEARGQA